MKLDAGLEAMEDGYVTEAEQIDQETEYEDMENLLDNDIMDPDSLDTDLEDAYQGFHDNKGFDGIAVGGYTEGQLERIVEDEVGLDLSEEGFHVEDEFGRMVDGDDIPNAGRMSDYDVEELSNDISEVTIDEAEAIDYGFDIGRYSSEAGDMDVVEPVVSETEEELASE